MALNKRLILLLIAAGLVAGGTANIAIAEGSGHSVKKATQKKSAARKSTAHKRQTIARRKAVPVEDPRHLVVQSSAVIVQDEATGVVLYEKNADAVVPIASITKLMTAMVVLDAGPSLSETLTVEMDDVDTLKGTTSRLRVGTSLSREDMLRLALMSSENRAASVLSRYYPGGRDTFIAAMNAKARMLGLSETRFEDPTGLNAANVSSARDLVKLVGEAHQYPLIREFSTSAEYDVVVAGRTQTFRNTNPLVRSHGNDWEIGLSKTGYINEAGKCLVMQAWLNNKPTIIVLLDSWGRLTRIGDANRIKRWIETNVARQPRTG